MLGSCLAVGALAAGLSACSTSLTAFAGGQPPLTELVHLDRSVVRTGERVAAELVLQNSSGQTVVLDRGCRGGFVQLVLSRGSLTAGGAWALPLCRPGVAFVAHPGTTRYPLWIDATYSECTMVGHRPSGGSPQCLTRNGMPPLPAGTYKVSIAAVDKKLQSELAHIRAARVRVIG